MKTAKEIAHYAYFTMLSSGGEKDVEDIVARDLADIENKINEHTNSKLKRAIGEIKKWKLDTQHFGTSYQIINDIIEIIEKEITKKK